MGRRLAHTLVASLQSSPVNDPQIRPSKLATPEGVAHPKLIKSFVRRTGRTTTGQAKALADIGPRFMLPYQASLADWLTAAAPPLILEIGFGMGEATAHIEIGRAHV